MPLRFLVKGITNSTPHEYFQSRYKMANQFQSNKVLFLPMVIS